MIVIPGILKRKKLEKRLIKWESRAVIALKRGESTLKYVKKTDFYLKSLFSIDSTVFDYQQEPVMQDIQGPHKTWFQMLQEFNELSFDGMQERLDFLDHSFATSRLIPTMCVSLQ